MVHPSCPDSKQMALFESGATTLLYLASKTGKLLPKTDRAKFKVMQWLMFQMGGVGPMLGQTHHFRIYAPEKIDYAINRYTNETRRLYGAIDKELSKKPYIAGEQYSIADIAIFPWTSSWKNQGLTLEEFPNALRWHQEIAARPAVQRGVEVLISLRKPLIDDKAKENIYGKTQHQQR